MKNLKIYFFWLLFCYLMGSCQCGNPGPGPSYMAWIAYRNSKSEDLLDAKTIGHFDPNIIVNGYVGTIEKTDSSNWSGPLDFQKGYYLRVGLNIDKPYTTILLNKSISDTLFYTFSGNQLKNCKYNKMDVPLGVYNYFRVSVLK